MITRITQKMVDALKSQIEEMRDCKELQIEIEEEKPYPNQERLDKLEEQANVFEEILNLLEDYEV